MIRKYHNLILQTNPWHNEEESNNNQEPPGRQTKQSNQFSLPFQDDCKARMQSIYQWNFVDATLPIVLVGFFGNFADVFVKV